MCFYNERTYEQCDHMRLIRVAACQRSLQGMKCNNVNVHEYDEYDLKCPDCRDRDPSERPPTPGPDTESRYYARWNERVDRDKAWSRIYPHEETPIKVAIPKTWKQTIVEVIWGKEETEEEKAKRIQEYREKKLREWWENEEKKIPTWKSIRRTPTRVLRRRVLGHR